MARVHLVEDSIDISEELLLGEFSNAFRVLPSTRGECYLDFILYSEGARKAVVIQRVRVRQEFLAHVTSLMSEVLQDNQALGSFFEFQR